MARQMDAGVRVLYDRLYDRCDLRVAQAPKTIAAVLVVGWLLCGVFNYVVLDRGYGERSTRVIHALAFGPTFGPLEIARAGRTVRVGTVRVPTGLAAAGIGGGMFAICCVLATAGSQDAAQRAKQRRKARQHAERQGRPQPRVMKRTFGLTGPGLPLGLVEDTVIGIPYGVNKGHCAVVAPTLSGKGLHATETLLRWPDAAVVVDPKSELYMRTAGSRSTACGSVFRVPQCSIDLLDYYRITDPLDVQDLHQTLLRIWQDREPIFAHKTLPLFFAAAKCGQATGVHPLRLLASWAQLAAPDAMRAARRHAPVEVDQFLDGDDLDGGLNRFASSAWGTFTARFVPLIPHIHTVTTGEIPPTWLAERSTVYLTYPLDQLSTAGPLVSAILGAFMKAKMQAETSGQPRQFTLFVLDEMPTTAMPKLDQYLSIMGGFGATALLYLQSLSQLDEVYGEHRARTILANCHQQLYYATRDPQTAEYVAKMFGTQLDFVQSESRSRSIGNGPGYGRRHSSATYQEVLRPALDSTEINTLPEAAVVILALADRQYRILAERLNPLARLDTLPPPPPCSVVRREYGTVPPRLAGISLPSHMAPPVAADVPPATAPAAAAPARDRPREQRRKAQELDF